MEHHVGELVVAVHDPRLVAAGPAPPEPVAGGVEAGEVPELEPVEVRVPAVHLALVEPVGPAQPLQAPRPPVDPGQPGDGLHQLVGQARSGLQVGVERLGPLRLADRRPAVHQLHQVEGRPQNLGVVAGTDCGRVGDVGAGQRGQDAVLAHHGLVAARRHPPRRPAQSPAMPAPAHLEDLVGRPAGDEPARQRLALPRQALAVHPSREALRIDQSGGALGVAHSGRSYPSTPGSAL